MTASERYKLRNEPMAVSEAIRSGVPASITLAQGILESKAGLSELAVKANNHFGIKCHGWSGEHIIADDDQPGECFRKYNSVADSYKDHSDFLKQFDRYQNLFKLSNTDYIGWANGLQQAGYATSPTYANTLLQVIQDNKLYEADQKTKFRKVMKIVNVALIILLVSLLIFLALRYRQSKKAA